MPHYTYLIVGGGMTADAAVRGIRQVDNHGSIGLLSAEKYAPYNRPPLSKQLWKGKPLEKIWRNTDQCAVELHLGRTVQRLNPSEKSVVDDTGARTTFDRLLLATGGTPRRLPFGGDHIIYYRTLDDYQRLRALADQGQRFAVIGGGFIGSEIAAALAMNQKEVIMIFPEDSIGARAYPSSLSFFLSDFYHRKGVEILAHQTVSDVARQADRLVIRTSGQREIAVDGVIAGIGIEPNVRLAEQAGLEIHNGIVVDEFLRAGHPDIYAAGDVAAFFNPALDKRMRVEHEDNANTMGQRAGRNMAGEQQPYQHLPFFYSDLFELGYEAVGELNARYEIVADWKEIHREGVVYYLQDRRVCGVLLWNVWNQVEAARQLIAEPGPFTAADLKGRLPA